MFIQTQPTPNPATLKFLPGQDVSPSTPYEFASQDEAAASPLASALFGVNGVTGVFFGSDFVSITKNEDADWSVVKPQALAVFTISSTRPCRLANETLLPSMLWA